jgi:hypothetical protein
MFLHMLVKLINMFTLGLKFGFESLEPTCSEFISICSFASVCSCGAQCYILFSFLVSDIQFLTRILALPESIPAVALAVILLLFYLIG